MDMVGSVGAALVQGMVQNMDPSRAIILEQLSNISKQATLDIEDRKTLMLKQLRKDLSDAEQAEPRSVGTIESIERSIRRIEAI